MHTAIKTHALSVHSEDGTTLLNEVDLNVTVGERVALMGRSGSGKSLLSSCLAGGLSPVLRRTGIVEIQGNPVKNSHVGRIPRVAVVRQDSSEALNPLVRIGPQLMLPLKVSRRNAAPAGGSGQLLKRVLELLEAVGLPDGHRITRSFPAQLSGGQRQRVCIALALACEPEILVADEPTTALDVVSQATVMEALSANIAPSCTLIFVTHDLTVASTLCERAVVMDSGRIVEDKPMHHLIISPDHALSVSLVTEAVRRSEVSA
ncbi:ATP-binding cassette domain-containing protein [Nesterenkonia sandarakina]|uniref:Peptide/nickel transport system ATP-binding protein n=1 Tax=Nesterenkonia sandarakina TaxID=272918 RepID=A0A2T0YBK8_9MICC|nr:ATP-binding cassette domain-containing protein [Nesterenkonia sandarakina]PRZ12014.1 peptide/nickel transport system ATP-binding protein [Nesterenkonia sandarakina]